MVDTTATATDQPANEAIRLFKNGKWGNRGFAMPWYPETCVAGNNADVIELHDDLGKKLLNVMSRPDAMSSAPPTMPVLVLVHKLVQRYRQVIAGEIILSNEVSLSPPHISPGANPFMIHPCPYFNVRNK